VLLERADDAVDLDYAFLGVRPEQMSGTGNELRRGIGEKQRSDERGRDAGYLKESGVLSVVWTGLYGWDGTGRVNCVKPGGTDFP